MFLMLQFFFENLITSKEGQISVVKQKYVLFINIIIIFKCILDSNNMKEHCFRIKCEGQNYGEQCLKLGKLLLVFFKREEYK